MINIQQEWLMADLHKEDWNLYFRRNVGVDEVEEWEEMQTSLGIVDVKSEEGILFLKSEVWGKFSTKSLYKLITFGGVIDQMMKDIW